MKLYFLTSRLLLLPAPLEREPFPLAGNFKIIKIFQNINIRIRTGNINMVRCIHTNSYADQYRQDILVQNEVQREGGMSGAKHVISCRDTHTPP